MCIIVKTHSVNMEPSRALMYCSDCCLFIMVLQRNRFEQFWFLLQF